MRRDLRNLFSLAKWSDPDGDYRELWAQSSHEKASHMWPFIAEVNRRLKTIWLAKPRAVETEEGD
jgi:hypothetical protein